MLKNLGIVSGAPLNSDLKFNQAFSRSTGTPPSYPNDRCNISWVGSTFPLPSQKDASKPYMSKNLMNPPTKCSLKRKW